MTFVIGLTGLVVAGLIAVILANPFITIKGVRYKIVYWFVPLSGAIVLFASGHLKASEIWTGLTGSGNINPLKILVLFISMTVLSIFLDEAGMFHYLAGVALNRAKTSQKKLFFYLFLMVSVLTVFTSNDIIILTFTPFICYFSRNAKINPIPFLFGEFVAANTWSMMLIIGNPTNIYLAGSAGLNFFGYTKIMFLPTVLAGIIAYFALLITFRKDLCKPLCAGEDDFSMEDKGLVYIGVAHLGLCTLLLVVSSYVNLEMWAITLFFAVSLFIFVTFYKKKPGRNKARVPHPKTDHILLHTIRRAPWELIPFVLSMFTVVLALNKYNVTGLISDYLGSSIPIIKYGISSFLVANLMNNIPMAVLFSSITSHLKDVSDTAHMQALFSAIIGSNIGAFFTPLGALAGIMWSGILKKMGVDFNFRKYVRYGAPISFAVLTAALLGLYIML